MPANATHWTLTGSGLTFQIDADTGCIVRLTHDTAKDAFVSADTLPGGLEVFDELDRTWYTDLKTRSTVSDVRQGQGYVRFAKRFEGAPFVLHCGWRAEGDGVYLMVDAELDKGTPQRSIRISFVLPATPTLHTWTASYPPPADVHTNPTPYCYLADEKGKARTGIPMLTLFHPNGGGLSMVMPFEIPKVQLNLGAEPVDPTPWYTPERIPRINAGAEVDTVTPPEAADIGDTPVIRFTEKHVGLRPGKRLRFGLWFYGHQADWRPGLGRVVEKYADYFEPSPAALAKAGGRFRGNPNQATAENIERAKGMDLTHSWFHAHFEFHGEFLTDEAMTDPSYRWLCEPYPKEFFDLGVERVRSQIRMLKDAGIGTFLYGFNMHCDTTIIDKRDLHADVAKLEDGQIARAYHEQPVMFFNPASPFGRQQLEQMDRMIAAYPEIMGVALDNWNYAGIDFGHDDGVTMVNSKTAANINFSQQTIITAIADKMHRSGRLVCTNKGRTIESFRGVDFCLTEAHGAQTYATFAYMNCCRTVAPAEYQSSEDPAYAEYVLKYLLVWSGQMTTMEMFCDIEQAKAYQPLLRLLRNSRYVFDPDPVTLPDGVEGNIFRIDPRSPFNPGAVMVTLVQPDVSWRDGAASEGLSVSVRLPDADRLTRAQWVGVERSADAPIDCPITRNGDELSIALPAVGAAGVLKLY